MGRAAERQRLLAMGLLRQCFCLGTAWRFPVNTECELVQSYFQTEAMGRGDLVTSPRGRPAWSNPHRPRRLVPLVLGTSARTA